MTHKWLNVDEAARVLGGIARGVTREDVRRYVIEDRTLQALLVDMHGHVKPFHFMGLRVHTVNADCTVTDYRGNPAGFLRFEASEVLRLRRDWLLASRESASVFGTHTPRAIESGPDEPIVQSIPPVSNESAPLASIVHTTKPRRRDTLTPVIEAAQACCRNPKDTAEVWNALLVQAERRSAPLIGATEDGLQYLKDGSAAFFTRDALRKRLGR